VVFDWWPADSSAYNCYFTGLWCDTLVRFYACHVLMLVTFDVFESSF
jgi:hypothetical protein